jgi:hypothetical protein
MNGGISHNPNKFVGIGFKDKNILNCMKRAQKLLVEATVKLEFGSFSEYLLEIAYANFYRYS